MFICAVLELLSAAGSGMPQPYIPDSSSVAWLDLVWHAGVPFSKIRQALEISSRNKNVLDLPEVSDCQCTRSSGR